MEQYNTPIEKLELSSRTLNCLKRSNINKVGQVLEVTAADLLKIRNFGNKSLVELNAKLVEYGFSSEEVSTEENPNLSDVSIDEVEPGVEVTVVEEL